MSTCAEIQLDYEQQAGIPWRNRKMDDLPVDKQDSGKISTWPPDWKASLESAWNQPGLSCASHSSQTGVDMSGWIGIC